MPLSVIPFLCLEDNYGVLLIDRESGEVAAVDAPDITAIERAVTKHTGRLDALFITHHHWDHTQAILPLKEAYGCKVYGPALSRDKIAGIDISLKEGDSVMLGASCAEVIAIPGHTLDHIAYHFPLDRVAFVADTLFFMGCGRVFEGTMEQMWESLCRIGALPPLTKLYFGHDYSSGNVAFARKMFPDNGAIAARGEYLARLRVEGVFPLPTTVAEERETNPFLQAAYEETAVKLGMAGAKPVEVFVALRRLKDQG